MRQVENDILERNAALLPQPFVFLIIPIVWLHGANISLCVHYGNRSYGLYFRGQNMTDEKSLAWQDSIAAFQFRQVGVDAEGKPLIEHLARDVFP